MAKKSSFKPAAGRRAVVVSGVRTPFCKAFTDLTELDTIKLGAAAVSALLKKMELPAREVDSIVWGGVILPPLSVNVGREIVLELKLPPTIEGYTVTRACTSGLQAITNAVYAIERGDADVVIAGGSDSTSNAPIAFPPKVVHKLGPLVLGGKGTPGDYLGALAQLMPISEILPRPPKIAERTTGEVMGESAERMAQRNEISREAQDELAARSHHRAAAAIASGRFDDEVTKVQTPKGWVHVDNLVRADTSVEKLAKLRPVFAKDGTITAGNASPLTDGAAATVLMSEEKAKALGYAPLGYIRSYAFTAVNPGDQLLQGPAYAAPAALDAAGVKLADVDLIEMHEAFAAQILSNMKAFASKKFAERELGRSEPLGVVDFDRFNVTGGSIAIGHPFGATGARVVTQLLYELRRRGQNLGLVTVCAAGGVGFAMVVERE
jgi:acetyl-CoA acyltransferase